MTHTPLVIELTILVLAIFLGFDRQIDERHVRRRDANRHAVQFAFELRQDEVKGLGRARGRGNHGHARRPRAP